MEPQETRIVAVVATVPSRASLHLDKALQSIAAQARQPDALVVVVDYAPDGEEHRVRRQRAEERAQQIREQLVNSTSGSARAAVLVNERTKNHSGTGCWNTGIMHAIPMEPDANLTNTFIAVLDDDDEWKPEHLLQCEARARAGIDWVVCGIERREGGEPVYERATAETLSEQSLLRGNPGVQGSNLFVRLPRLLRAGLFDENLPSMTDRDLALRLLETGDIGSIAFVPEHTVIHHAEPGRERVTVCREAKVCGAQRFLWKHGWRFSAEDLHVFSERCRKKFGFTLEQDVKQSSGGSMRVQEQKATWPTTAGDEIAVQNSTRRYLVSLFEKPTAASGAETRRARGLFGIVSSSEARVAPLLRDIANLPPHIVPVVIVLSNGDGLALGLQDVMNQGCQRIEVQTIDRSAPAVAATVKHYLATLRGGGCHVGALEFSSGQLPICLARTVLQAHMATKLESARGSEAFDFAMVLDDDKRLPRDTFLGAHYFFSLDRSTIYIGSDCKTAPNTIAYGLRVQLLDLWFSLASAGRSDFGQLSTCAQKPADAYYDLSTSRYDHLEEPQLVPLIDLDAVHGRLLRGDPLARDSLPGEQEAETRQRGGCMLLFSENFGCLKVPQFAPELAAEAATLLSRRSDSLWLREQSRRGVRCVALPALFVLHQNEHDSLISGAKLRDNALAETCGATLCRDIPDRGRYLQQRVRAMLANNERIRGLLFLLRGLNRPELEVLLTELDQAYTAASWDAAVFRPLRAVARHLLVWSPTQLMDVWGDASSVQARVARAQRTIERVRPSAQLCFVGLGSEGVVFRCGGRCFKVFDADDGTHSTESALSLLRTNRVLECERLGAEVITYNFVSGRMYSGGHGQELVSMLRRLRESNLVMRNLKPANLVIDDTGSRVEVVDLGHDWVPFSPALWVSMCRRAFLCWRFGRWCTTFEGDKQLQLLLSAERSDKHFPELTGFKRFLDACNEGPPFIDCERFEKTLCGTLDQSYSTQRVSAPQSRATFVIKTCLMEAATLVFNVRHLVWTLRRSSTVFAEVLLSVDRTRRVNLLRQYNSVDEVAFDEALQQLRCEKLVDRVVDFDGSKAEAAALVERLNVKYLGVNDSAATHSLSGAPHAPLFHALDSVTTDLVLQADSDICLNMDAPEDLVARASALFNRDERAVTALGLPIYEGRSGSTQGCGVDDFTGNPFRMEIRFCFLHLPRLRAMLPLQIAEDERVRETGDVILRRGWYHVFDQNLRQRGLRSYRFVSGNGFFVHPPNDAKRNRREYALLADRLASPDVVRNMRPSSSNNAQPTVPAEDAWNQQRGSNDALLDVNWFGERAEQLVFVCCGRNQSYGRALRCLESLAVQRGSETAGVVVVDDASEADPWPLFESARHLFPGRVSCIYTGVRLGYLRATSHAIKRVCVNPSTAVCLLDLDDMLFEQREGELSVIEHVQRALWLNGQPRTDRLVAIGGMVRHSKFKRYPLVSLGGPRTAPAVGNVWKHLRCFRKFLFDLIAENNFRTLRDGDESWIDHGADWAFMVPIVEQAGADRVYEFSPSCSFYFYEESTQQNSADKHAGLEMTRAFLTGLPSFLRCTDALSAQKLLGKPVGKPLSVCRLPVAEAPSDDYELLNVAGPGRVRYLVHVRGRDKLVGCKLVPARIHSECFTGDVLGSLRCDCGEQLKRFQSEMHRSECAVLIYVSGHEGRGNGLDIKLCEYAMQDQYPEANHVDLLTKAGGVPDCRSYIDCANILRYELKIESLVLHTNNPRKVCDVKAVFGPVNVQAASMSATVTAFNAKYLREKVEYLGHDDKLVDSSVHKAPEGVSEFIGSMDPRPEADASYASYVTLCQTIRCMLEQQPFHNLTLLGACRSADMTGVCFDRNVFLKHALTRLGFSVRVIGAYTRFFLEMPKNEVLRRRGQFPPLPNHICLIVRVTETETEREYLVDVGNGSPYFSPLRLGDSQASFHHSDLHYRLQRGPHGMHAIEHCRSRPTRTGTCFEWKMNYCFDPKRSLSQYQIDSIVRAHTTDPDFGHMLLSLRLSRWKLEGKSVALKDTRARVIGSDGTEMEHVEFESALQLRGFVLQHFGSEILLQLNSAAPILVDYLKAMRHDSPELLTLMEDCLRTAAGDDGGDLLDDLIESKGQLSAATAANKRRLGDECAQAMDVGIRVNPLLQRAVRSQTARAGSDDEQSTGRGDETSVGETREMRREDGERRESRKRKAEGPLDAWVERGVAKGARGEGSHSSGESDCSDRNDGTGGEPS